jgi:hypothetical protein
LRPFPWLRKISFQTNSHRGAARPEEYPSHYRSKAVGRDVETHGGILFRLFQGGEARAGKFFLACDEVADQVLVFDPQVKVAKQLGASHVAYPYVELRRDLPAIFVDIDAVFDAHDASASSSCERHIVMAN